MDARDAGLPEAPPPQAGAELPPAPPEPQESEAPAEPPSLSTAEVGHLLEVSRNLLTYRYVKVGRYGSYRMDCSGFVRAVHLSLGLDLFVPGVPGQAVHVGGVGLVLWYNQVHGTFWPRTGAPEQYPVTAQPGDIVYFHDTHDRNKNRRFDDPFTHVGLVEAVDGDGTVTFLHAAGHIVKREKMNLQHPHQTRDAAGNIINHTLRVRKRWEKASDPRLAAELFAGFGRLVRPPSAAAFSEQSAVPVLPSGKPILKGVRRPKVSRRLAVTQKAPKRQPQSRHHP